MILKRNVGILSDWGPQTVTCHQEKKHQREKHCNHEVKKIYFPCLMLDNHSYDYVKRKLAQFQGKTRWNCELETKRRVPASSRSSFTEEGQ